LYECRSGQRGATTLQLGSNRRSRRIGHRIGFLDDRGIETLVLVYMSLEDHIGCGEFQLVDVLDDIDDSCLQKVGYFRLAEFFLLAT